jgi:hypothetical protein
MRPMQQKILLYELKTSYNKLVRLSLSDTSAHKHTSLPYEWSPVRGCTWEGSSLTCKYKTRAEVTDSDKHSCLLRYEIFGVSFQRWRLVCTFDIFLKVTNTLA